MDNHPIGTDEKGALVFSKVKTDADIAAELREEITPHMNALCKVMEKSLTHGMQISFAMNPDAFGRYIPPFINITKAL